MNQTEKITRLNALLERVQSRAGQRRAPGVVAVAATPATPTRTAAAVTTVAGAPKPGEKLTAGQLATAAGVVVQPTPQTRQPATALDKLDEIGVTPTPTAAAPARAARGVAPVQPPRAQLGPQQVGAATPPKEPELELLEADLTSMEEALKSSAAAPLAPSVAQLGKTVDLEAPPAGQGPLELAPKPAPKVEPPSEAEAVIPAATPPGVYTDDLRQPVGAAIAQAAKVAAATTSATFAQEPATVPRAPLPEEMPTVPRMAQMEAVTSVHIAAAGDKVEPKVAKVARAPAAPTKAGADLAVVDLLDWVVEEEPAGEPERAAPGAAERKPPAPAPAAEAEPATIAQPKPAAAAEPKPAVVAERKPEDAAARAEPSVATVKLTPSPAPAPLAGPDARQQPPAVLEVESVLVSARLAGAAQVAAFVGAAQSFKPATFAELLDASLSLGG